MALADARQLGTSSPNAGIAQMLTVMNRGVFGPGRVRSKKPALSLLSIIGGTYLPLLIQKAPERSGAKTNDGCAVRAIDRFVGKMH